LRDDIDTIPVVFDHAGDAANLTFDPSAWTEFSRSIRNDRLGVTGRGAPEILTPSPAWAFCI
jgi:hypothetical protein